MRDAGGAGRLFLAEVPRRGVETGGPSDERIRSGAAGAGEIRAIEGHRGNRAGRPVSRRQHHRSILEQSSGRTGLNYGSTLGSVGVAGVLLRGLEKSRGAWEE